MKRQPAPRVGCLFLFTRHGAVSHARDPDPAHAAARVGSGSGGGRRRLGPGGGRGTSARGHPPSARIRGDRAAVPRNATPARRRGGPRTDRMGRDVGGRAPALPDRRAADHGDRRRRRRPPDPVVPGPGPRHRPGVGRSRSFAIRDRGERGFSRRSLAGRSRPAAAGRRHAGRPGRRLHVDATDRRRPRRRPGVHRRFASPRRCIVGRGRTLTPRRRAHARAVRATRRVPGGPAAGCPPHSSRSARRPSGGGRLGRWDPPRRRL